jgi:hypothetical protein
LIHFFTTIAPSLKIPVAPRVLAPIVHHLTLN